MAATDARIRECMTEMLTDELDLRVAALADDGDPWATAACVIGIEVSIVVDVLRR